MTATVTDIRALRHSWDKQPRKDDPSRHIRTCRRCGVKKRSEPVGGGWVELWLAADGTTGEGKPPTCGAPQAEPAPAPAAVSAPPQVAHPCCRCVPPLEPCGQPTHPYLGGWMCDWQAGRSSGGAA